MRRAWVCGMHDDDHLMMHYDAPDFAEAFPEEAATLEADEEEESCSGGRGDAGAAEMVGFAGVTSRLEVRRLHGGTFDTVVHELDVSRFWNMQRWVLRPARLLYCYEANRDASPTAIVDYDGVVRRLPRCGVPLTARA